MKFHSSFDLGYAMGNNCCNSQSGSIDGYGTERSEDIQTVVRSSENHRGYHDDLIKTNPQQKMNEYYQILREAQMDNLKKMREHLKRNPELFLLNNVILSIQFFDNFDR